MVGVVLEGGGARGAYHAGAIKALKSKGIRIDGYVGTSIGAINAALATYKTPDEIIGIWKNSNSETIFGLDNELISELLGKNFTKDNIKKLFVGSKKIIKEKGIDIKKISNFLNNIVEEDKIRKSKKEFGLVTFNKSDFKSEKKFKKDIPNGKLVEYLIASSYLPVFKTEKIIDDKYYMDGGISDNLPVNMLLEKNYDKIYAVRTYGIGRIKKVKSDKVIYIKPRKKLGSILAFDPKMAEKNIKLGYFDTLKELDNLDGCDYYIKHKSEKYYKRVLKDLSFRQMTALKLEYKTVSNKIIATKLIEEAAKSIDLDEFKVYRFSTLLLKVKFNMDKKHKKYKIIKKLNVIVF